MCEPIPANPARLGETCSWGECEAGTMCWDFDDDTGLGICRPVCTGSIDEPSCSDSSLVCAHYFNWPIQLCREPCDPLGDECAPGWNCQHSGLTGHFACMPDTDPEASQYGDPCNGASDCSPGLTCTFKAVPDCADDGDLCCTALCDLDLPNTCPGAPQQVCRAFVPTVPEFAHVGYCSVM